MALYPGALQGARGAQEASDRPLAAPAFGAVTSVTLTAAVSQNIPLPVDANGRVYPAYMFLATASTWFSFASASGDTSAGGLGYPIFPPSPPTLIATPQAIMSGGGAFIAAFSTPGGTFSIIGLF